MRKTILLTGGTGFLGSHLIKNLIDKHRIIILKRSFSNTCRISNFLNKIKYYDIDKTDISTPFKENKIDYVIHTAVNYGRKGESLTDIINDNLVFTIKLLEKSALFNLEFFLNTDTLLYGNINYYILSKKHLIDYLKIFNKKIKIINLRIEHIYGPMDDEKKFVCWVIKNLINNIPELNLTKGEQKRDFIYINDVVNAYILIIEKLDRIKKGFNEFDVGTGKFITIKDFVLKIKNIIENKFNKKIETKLNFGALPYRENELFEIKENLCPLLNFGWNPKYDLDLGLYETIKYELEVKK